MYDTVENSKHRQEHIRGREHETTTHLIKFKFLPTLVVLLNLAAHVTHHEWVWFGASGLLTCYAVIENGVQRESCRRSSVGKVTKALCTPKIAKGPLIASKIATLAR